MDVNYSSSDESSTFPFERKTQTQPALASTVDEGGEQYATNENVKSRKKGA